MKLNIIFFKALIVFLIKSICFFSIGNITFEASKANPLHYYKIYSNQDDISIQNILILNSKDQHQLKISLKEYEELKKNKIICAHQLNNHQIPFACFKTLSLEEKLKLLPNDQISTARNQLDLICNNIVINKKIDYKFLEKTPIGPICQESLNKKKEINTYIEIDEDSESIFNQRFFGF